MSDDNKKDDLLKELEIQSILDESRSLAAQEQMKRNAQKYRAKPKMKDIYSNADQKPRLKNSNPLDIDGADREEIKADTTNTIVGEKTATTMKAELIMNGSEEVVQTPQEAIAEAEKKAKEGQEAKPVQSEKAGNVDTGVKPSEEQNENKIVTLTPEYDDETQFSNEVIGEVEQFKEIPAIEDIDSIDIDMDDEEFEKIQKPQASEEKGKYEQLFGIKNNADGQPPKKVVAKVPVYKQDEPNGILNVKAGRFSEVLEHEYQEYIRSKNPSVIAHVIKPEPTPQSEYEEEKKKDTRSTKEKILSAVVGFFSKDESDDSDTPNDKKEKPVDDYTGDDDEKSIRYELNLNIKKLFVRSVLSGAIAAVSVILTVLTRFFPEAICSAVAFAPAAYAVFNLLLIGLSLFLNRVAMLGGLTPLAKFKGNSDTAVAVGGVAAFIQTVVSFFCLGDLSSFNTNYYCTIVLLAFFCNNIGKFFMVLRVKDNFRFASAKGQKYAAKIYNNEAVANKMLSGTPSEKTLIAYQHRTDFPSNFLKISYAPDPSEDLASKLAPITTIVAIIVTLLYGFAKVSFVDAINTFSLVTALAIPISTLVAVNLPIRRLCKTLLTFDSMLAGYPSIKQFCDSTAIMIDANELFPADSIELEGIKTYEEYNLDESLLCGIAILKEAENPIANAFDSVITEANEKLPEVESVLYEDGMGLVGWINSERILVGSRTLMEKYSVHVPSSDYDEQYTAKGRQVTYISRAGRLVAMIVTRYHADSQLKTEMQRAEANGISFLIRTTDYNITDDLVASLYNLFYRSIKVLPTGLGNVLKEAQGTKEESSRSYLITHGNVSSLARAVSGSVRIKHNISLAIVIQLVAIILGILIASTLSLYAGVSVMGSLEVLIFAIFWSVAAVIAPAIQKP